MPNVIIDGAFNTAVGEVALEVNTTGTDNTAIGFGALVNNTTGTFNTAIGEDAGVSTGDLNFTTAVGAFAIATSSHTVVLGTDQEKVIAAGTMRVHSIPPGASTGQVCFNAPGDLLQCPPSSIRYKKDVRQFGEGLDVVLKLRPVNFTWKSDGRADVGLIAEEVAEIAPAFVFNNGTGQIEGVNYDRMAIVLINAIKEQQGQIERQHEQITLQQKEIDELKAALKAQAGLKTAKLPKPR
ncbi:MAG TPA: tail fiber domain-containing protein [Candidatus Binatia bacterium]